MKRLEHALGVIRSASQFMRPLTLSETVENLIRVNWWNSWRFLLATNSTNFTKTITAIWMSLVRNTLFSQPLPPRCLTPTFNLHPNALAHLLKSLNRCMISGLTIDEW